ncbi:hypothetical protein A5791_20110 [Mycobacterium sp. 852002-51163_SCH5372311]|uniref:hypothetical protein n=1 Tax=Mycobacterium sp. 852002-51163_SCH5372311 TaxID=1834097 RepID=UPI0007FE88E4|nr:hypothetical protein [Mycobacterium sp. 852002-51163_SCH5372311]OBF86728.1 hypothetical protein A5791_20110 [Mycobacterium sp. 852002-51163_SCH5372311]
MFGGKSGAAGRASAVGWAVALVAALIALANGYLLLAGASLILAFLVPWFGLAAVLHSKPSVFDSELPWQDGRSVNPVPESSSGYRIRLPAR